MEGVQLGMQIPGGPVARVEPLRGPPTPIVIATPTPAELLMIVEGGMEEIETVMAEER
jgi:hypothetical protein